MDDVQRNQDEDEDEDEDKDKDGDGDDGDDEDATDDLGTSQLVPLARATRALSEFGFVHGLSVANYDILRHGRWEGIFK